MSDAPFSSHPKFTKTYAFNIGFRSTPVAFKTTFKIRCFIPAFARRILKYFLIGFHSTYFIEFQLVII